MTRHFSAGGVVYKKEATNILWLIIKPKPSVDFPKDRYQLPKGLINKNETPEEAAVREVQEETGITGKIISKIDTSKFIFTFRGERIFKIVTWYLMAYVSGTPTPDHTETEEVLWLSYDTAYKILTYSSDKTILEKASKMVESQ